jgi:hypothetical protein
MVSDPIHLFGIRARQFICQLFCIGFLASCGGVSPHQNFINIMNVSVGRDSDAPYSFRNNIRIHHLVAVRPLKNGNIEEEFKIGRRLNCRVFFEVDESKKTVVGWRYEGTEQDCVIVP